MPSKIEMLLEAERRGLLPPDKISALQELRQRGKLPGLSGSASSYVETPVEYEPAPADNANSVSTIKQPAPSFADLPQDQQETLHKQLYNELNGITPPSPEKPEWRNNPNLSGLYGAGKAVLEQAIRPAAETTGAVIGGTVGAINPLLGGALGYGAASKGMDVLEDTYNRFGGEPVQKRTIPGEILDSAVDVGSAYLTGKAMDKGMSILDKALDKSSTAINSQINKVVKRGINKGVRPSVVKKEMAPQVEKYHDQAQTAVKEIIKNKDNLKLIDESGLSRSGLPKNLDEFSQAIDQTKRQIFNKYSAMAEAAGEGGARVPLKPVIGELEKITKDVALQDNAPGIVAYAKRKIATFKDRGSYSVLDAQNSIQQLNESLKAYYRNPSPATQKRAYIDAAIANNLRSSLDDTITSIKGPGYSALKKQYGALREIEGDVTKRSIVDARKNVKGLADLTDVFTGYHVIDGILSGSGSKVVAGGMAKGLATASKLANNPNRHVRKMFQNTEKLLNKLPKESPAVELKRALPPEDPNTLKFGPEKAAQTSPPVKRWEPQKRPVLPKSDGDELMPRRDITETTHMDGGGITPAQRGLLERQKKQQTLTQELKKKAEAKQLKFGPEKETPTPKEKSAKPLSVEEKLKALGVKKPKKNDLQKDLKRQIAEDAKKKASKQVPTIIPEKNIAVKKSAVDIKPTQSGDKKVKVELSQYEKNNITPKKQKEYLLAEIDTAIDTALKKSGEFKNIDEFNRFYKGAKKEEIRMMGAFGGDKYIFKVPGDGEFEIFGDGLLEFKKGVKKDFPLTSLKKKFTPSQAGRINYSAENKKMKAVFGAPTKHIDPDMITSLQKSAEKADIPKERYLEWLQLQELKPQTKKAIAKIIKENK